MSTSQPTPHPPTPPTNQDATARAAFLARLDALLDSYETDETSERAPSSAPEPTPAAPTAQVGSAPVPTTPAVAPVPVPAPAPVPHPPAAPVHAAQPVPVQPSLQPVAAFPPAIPAAEPMPPALAPPAQSTMPTTVEQFSSPSQPLPTLRNPNPGAPEPPAPPRPLRRATPTANLDVDAAKRVRRSSPHLTTSKIMIVDDEKVNIMAVQHHLKREGYTQFFTTTQPREALSMLDEHNPDVLLLDIHMPDVSGLDILRLKALNPGYDHIPVIVLTASTDAETKREAIDLGANDFLTKPLDPNDLVPRVRNALVVKKHYDSIANQAAELDALVQRRTAELYQSRQQLILSLARAAEHRDNETGNHVIRVGRYAGIIAQELGWSEERADMLEQAARLHDVGKIGVPDHILFKPGKLDPEEYDIMKKHCAWGKGIIEPYAERDFQMLKSHATIGETILHVKSSPMLMMASRIAQTHHENWDGSGYPLGLKGEDIPIEGRITSVADVFDALSSKRPYKDPFPREKCFKIIDECRGSKFDPQVIDAFFRRSEEIIEVQIALMDHEVTAEEQQVREQVPPPAEEDGDGAAQ